MNQNYPKYGDNQQSEEERKQAEEKREQMRKDMLIQCLDQNARARLNTLATLKPEKAKMVENYIFSKASQGMMSQKITEQELINLLDTVAQSTKPPNKVIFDRRRAAIDSDDDF